MHCTERIRQLGAGAQTCNLRGRDHRKVQGQPRLMRLFLRQSPRPTAERVMGYSEVHSKHGRRSQECEVQSNTPGMWLTSADPLLLTREDARRVDDTDTF